MGRGLYFSSGVAPATVLSSTKAPVMMHNRQAETKDDLGMLVPLLWPKLMLSV
jgi:hypothetical protein